MKIDCLCKACNGKFYSVYVDNLPNPNREIECSLCGSVDVEIMVDEEKQLWEEDGNSVLECFDGELIYLCPGCRKVLERDESRHCDKCDMYFYSPDIYLVYVSAKLRKA